MNTRIAILAVVAVLALVGGVVVFTSGQSKTPVATPTPSASVALATATQTASPTAVRTPAPTASPTLVPTQAPTQSPTPVPTPQSYTISGKAVDASTGQAVPSMRLSAFVAEGFCQNMGKSPVSAASTGADGSFSIRVPPGTYIIAISGNSTHQGGFYNLSDCGSAERLVVNQNLSIVVKLQKR